MAYITCHLYSQYLAHDTQVAVTLPKDISKMPEGGYPLMYLLHGRGDDCTAWIRNTSAERYADEKNMALIMPSAETSFYTDGVYGKRYHSYLTKELPKIMKAWFPLSDDPKKTYIAGLSMGGYGALRIGLSLPEKFAAIGVFSAGIRPDQIPDYEASETGNQILHEDIRCAFGDGALKSDDNPYELIRSALDEGRRIPKIIHYEGRQDMLYQMNNDFRRFAEETLSGYTYEEWEGFHDWVFWDEALKKMLDEISRKEE